MFLGSSHFLMLLHAIAFLAILSESWSSPDENMCQSYFMVCNDLEMARQCQAEKWCETQGTACEAADLLKKGNPALFGAAASTVDLACDNNFLAFRRPHEVRKFLNIKIEMEENQSPFSVHFQFDGNTLSLQEHTTEKVAISMNDKTVYDNLYNNEVTPQN